MQELEAENKMNIRLTKNISSFTKYLFVYKGDSCLHSIMNQEREYIDNSPVRYLLHNSDPTHLNSNTAAGVYRRVAVQACVFICVYIQYLGFIMQLVVA